MAELTETMQREMQCTPENAGQVVAKLMHGVNHQGIVDGLVSDGMDELSAANLVDLMILAADAACDIRDQGEELEDMVKPLLACGVAEDLSRGLVLVAVDAIRREAGSYSNHAEIAHLKLAWCLVEGVRDGEDKDAILQDLVDAKLLFPSMAEQLYESTVEAQLAASRVLKGEDQSAVFKELALDRKPGFVTILAEQLILEAQQG